MMTTTHQQRASTFVGKQNIAQKNNSSRSQQGRCDRARAHKVSAQIGFGTDKKWGKTTIYPEWGSFPNSSNGVPAEWNNFTEEEYRKNADIEVIHGRWAMLAVPGIVIPEALGIPGGVWTETGKVFLDGETGRQSLLEFWPIYAAIQVGLMGAAEKFRTDGTGPAGFVPFKGEFTEKDFKGLDPINPGGPLDFFNVAATPQDLAILKVKEIKNGRCVSRLVSSRCVIA